MAMVRGFAVEAGAVGDLSTPNLQPKLDLCDIAAGVACIAGAVAGDGILAAVSLYDNDNNGQIDQTEVRAVPASLIVCQLS
jgi:hypothetical protein